MDAAPSQLNGDDAAVLYPADPNSRVVATTDMMVENRHFQQQWSTPEEIGHKAVVRNFADIAAMGARPVAALLAISAPSQTPLSFIQGLARGIAKRCAAYNAQLVGGDLTQSRDIIITVTAIGSLGGSRPPLELHRAKVGQQIVAHGQIGASAAGLALLKRFGRRGVMDLANPLLSQLVAAHCAPEIEAHRGVIARATGASAMTDNSDGLVVDLGLIAQRSGVRMDLIGAAIAPGPALHAAAELLDIDPWTWVLSGGEDHTLLATTSKDIPSGFRAIGTVRRGEGVTVDGAEVAYRDGWTAFGPGVGQ